MFRVFRKSQNPNNSVGINEMNKQQLNYKLIGKLLGNYMYLTTRILSVKECRV